VSKSQTTDQTPVAENVAASRKREFTAVAAATTVTVVLGIAANVLIGKVGQKVSDRINPPKPETDSTK